MKKILSAVLATVLLLGMLGISAFADGEGAQSAEVYVTVANKGELVMTQKKITVTDTDADGSLTVNDVLYLAHEDSYEGGAALGYATALTGWGLGVSKLWGDTSGNFGYYINNVSSNGLSDVIKAGDHIYAFVYSDPYCSDAYAAFNVSTVAVSANESITLELSATFYDMANGWTLTTVKLAGATITVDGRATSYKTDSDGKVTFALSDAGNHVISATTDERIIVPPVCTVSVSAPATADSNSKTRTVIIVASVAAVAVVACAAAYIVVKRKKK